MYSQYYTYLFTHCQVMAIHLLDAALTPCRRAAPRTAAHQAH